MDKKMTTLYEEYRSGLTDRRNFIKKLTLLTGSTVAALALVPSLEGNYIKAATPNQVFPDLNTENIKYPGETGEILGYMAWPKKGSKFPAVIVIHENKGLVPHIKDVTRRMAKEGFLALAPDALSPLGGTPSDPGKVGSMFQELNSDQTTKNFVAAVKYLKTNPLSSGKTGCTGFCWGGAMTNQVAVNSPDLDAAVPYYGKQPSAEQVAQIKAPIMAHYGEFDDRINKGIPAFEKALIKNNKEYQIFIYEDCGHAFNNDTNPDRYNEKAAKLAWSRTVGFFREKLT